MIKRFIVPSPTLIISALCLAHLCLFPQDSFSADQVPSQSPPVFQPDEIQHGFSEFDTLPEVYTDNPPVQSVDSMPQTESANGYKDPSTKPTGLFFRLEFAEGFEEEEGLRRGHMIEPINPTQVFAQDTRAVFLVFTVYKHYAPYQVFGRLYPKNAGNLDPSHLLDEDTMYLATEDESGYLQFFPPSGHWIPGSYQVKVYVGYEASSINHMGTMQFTVTSDPTSLTAPEQ